MPRLATKTLEGRTQWYWNISSAFRGRGQNITTGQAIESVRKLQDCSAPSTRLSLRLLSLMESIILMVVRENPKPADIYHIPFARSQITATQDLGQQSITQQPTQLQPVESGASNVA